MENDINQPWGPYRECLAQGMDGDHSNRHLDLSLLLPVLGLPIDDKYRLGVGARVSIPLTPSVDLGFTYAYHPVPTDKTFNGHHLDVFVGLPEKFEWGNWRLGIFSDVSNFTSLAELKNNSKAAGIFTGVDIALWSLTRSLDLNLNIDVGVATPLDDFKLDTFISGALELNWTL